MVMLRLAEITLIDAVTSQQVIIEAERNLTRYLPTVLPTFQLIVSRCLRVVADPLPGDLHPYVGLANQKDLPILVAALREACPWLITFNVRHFQPGHPSINVVRPGRFVQHVRGLLVSLSGNGNV